MKTRKCGENGCKSKMARLPLNCAVLGLTESMTFRDIRNSRLPPSPEARRKPGFLIFFSLCVMMSVWAWPLHPVLAAADEWSQAHAQAMDWAKEEKYGQALTALAQLQEKYPSVPRLLFDRAVVLHWAGRDKEATALYETKIAGLKDIPPYVQEAVANAYFRQANYALARPLYHNLASAGDLRGRRARLLEAEVLIRQSDPAGAQKIYEAFLQENPNDFEVYLARGRARLGNGDTWRSIEDFAAAQAIVAKQGDMDKKRKIDSLLASACLRAGDAERSAAVLKPYIQNGQADPAMQADYVAALRMGGNLDQAVSEANRLWPDLLKAPASGLRTLGDAYLLQENFDQAIRVYFLALQKEPQNYFATLGLASAKVQKGQLTEALPLYDQVVAQNPKLAEIVLDECLYFMTLGKTGAAQKIFAVVSARIPATSAFYRQYADRLKFTDAPRDAYKNFQILRGQP